MKELVLEVYITAKPGCREAYVQAIRQAGIQQKVREEEGCLAYDYYFSAEDPDVIVLCERWSDSASQAVHMTRPHMARLAELKERYVRSTRLVRLTQVD